MISKKITLLFLSIILPTISLFAQIAIETKPVLPAENTVAYFNQAIKEQSWLYNGKEYEYYLPRIVGTGYFTDTKAFEKGTVNYNGVVFENVPLMYDLNKDLVVSILHNGFTAFSLISEKVKEFTLFNHHFVRIEADSTKKNFLSTGFYDNIYSGKLKLYVKRTKSIQSNTENHTITEYFRAKDNYYLEKDGEYYSIDSEGAFLSLFKSQRKELKDQLKSAGLKYKKDPGKAAVLLATFYDSLAK